MEINTTAMGRSKDLLSKITVLFILTGSTFLCLGCSNQDDNLTGINNAAKQFANQHWTYYDPAKGELGSYLAYEYWVAKHFGPDGELGGSIVYTNSIDEWSELNWDQKLFYLPEEGFSKELDPDREKDEYFYDIIGRVDQFGAGWPADGDDPYNYRIQSFYQYEWNADNSYRNSYLNMIGGE